MWEVWFMHLRLERAGELGWLLSLSYRVDYKWSTVSVIFFCNNMIIICTTTVLIRLPYFSNLALQICCKIFFKKEILLSSYENVLQLPKLKFLFRELILFSNEY